VTAADIHVMTLDQIRAEAATFEERFRSRANGGVDMFAMSRQLPAHDFRRYIDLSREKRSLEKQLTVSNVFGGKK
jgi:hypothetical protein